MSATMARRRAKRTKAKKAAEAKAAAPVEQVQTKELPKTYRQTKK